MANAVTFWKGTKSAFDAKTIALGRIYFVTDDDNKGALYLGVQGENAVEARLISPARLTALTAEITDNLSTVTAKAVVDFVKAQIEKAFGAGSAYAGQIAEIEGRLDTAEDAIDAVEGRLDVVEPKVAAVEGVLAGYGSGEGLTATVKTDINAVKQDIEDVEGILAGFGGEGEPATVKGAIDDVKAIASAAMNFRGVKATVAELPTEGIENGDIYYVTEDDTEYVYIEAETRWEALGGYVKADVYTKAETDEAIDADVKAAKDVIDAYTVNGKAISTSPVLTGADINVDATAGAGTVAAKLSALQEAIDEITGTGEDGDPTSIAGLAVEIANIKNYTINKKKISENPVLVAKDIEDVYSITEVDNSLANKMDKVGSGKEGQVITADASGNSVASGYTLGGAALAETVSDKVLATEKAVEAAAEAAASAAKQAAIGDADSKLANKVDNTITVNGHALSANVTIAAADIADVYSMAQVDKAISDATLVWQDELEA